MMPQYHRFILDWIGALLLLFVAIKPNSYVNGSIIGIAIGLLLINGLEWLHSK
jgi:hypothetical protein